MNMGTWSAWVIMIYQCCINIAAISVANEVIMLSRHLEVSLRLAVTMARQKRHEFLTIEHLLLSL